MARTVTRMLREPPSGFDLIGMATHGYGWVARWTLGSVTERVLHGTKLPLFIVRPREVAKDT